MNAPSTTSSQQTVAANLATVRARIAGAAAKAGRDPAGITLVAVSKTHPAEAVAAALQAGQIHFGENRVQEAAAKFPALRTDWPALKLHLIGALQTNKARDAIHLADVIESLDRPRLADALARLADSGEPLPHLLIEINVGNEPQKPGVTRAEADSFIDQCHARFGPLVIGLMSVPPANEDPTPHFTWLAEKAKQHGLPTLSMGMSADFEIAIACGATHVRIGSAIFGARS